MYLLNSYLELVEVITSFVLVHPILSIYLMGSVVATGICYSLMSTGVIKQWTSSKEMAYLYAFLSSWLLVIVFLFGVFKGFFREIYIK